ncbi:MAG TPA: organomercurial lyase [Longimicrobiales bacterium]
MDSAALRIHIYNTLVASGRPPHLNREERQQVAAMKIGKTLIPHPQTGQVWMAGPFAAEPTQYKVTGTATWYANCAWDMLGIPLITQERVRIETQCAHCAEPMVLDASPDTPPASSNAIVHFLVPARKWYDDIGFT